MDQKNGSNPKKNVKRKIETEEEATARKAKQAEQKRMKRAQETPEELANRKRRDAEYQRKRRVNESEEEKKDRLEEAAQRGRNRILKESEEQKEARQEGDAQRARDKILKESEEEKKARLEEAAQRARDKILKESEEEKKARLEEAAQRARDKILKESEEEKKARLEEAAQRARDKILKESEEEKKARQKEDAERNRLKRSSETDKAKEKRQSTDSQRKKDKEAEEDDDTRKARLQDRITKRNDNITKKLQKKKNKTFGGPIIEEHNLGSLSEECIHCKALFFKDEIKGKKDAIHVCCSSGDIKMKNHFENFPPVLKELFVGDSARSKNFKANIRQFNSALSTASLGANIDEPPKGNGPYSFKIHGQVYHSIGPLHPKTGTKAKYGQIYFLDSTQAAKERLKISANSDCDKSIMEELSKLMSDINIFAKSYHMMGEVEAKEEADAYVYDRPANQIRMIFDIERPNLDLRRYNVPTSNEVAVVYVHQDGQMPLSRSIAALSKTAGMVRISDTDPCGDPMTYPLFFPRGDLGWHDNLRREKSGRKINHQPYYSHILQIRKHIFNPIHHGSNLMQQFVVDAWTKTEQYRLQWQKNNQSKIRAEEYKVVRDFVTGQDDGTAIGRRIILPSTFLGSPRKMLQDYQDAMAIVTKFGKPDIFTTFTCNPKWTEISENLKPGQEPSDRPDLIARVFKLKVDEFFHTILKQHLLGEVCAYVAVYEWQKRGLPHIHVLLTMKEGHKPKTREDIDKLISAEIPDASVDPKLYDIVVRNMLHRPCGLDNPESPCMRDGICSKRFPKDFCDETKVNVNGYPEYRRRDDGRFVMHNKKCKLDNRRVVPFNRELLLRFNAHINVEICAQIEAIKYLFKYVYKGSDRAAIKMLRETVDKNGRAIDETVQFLDCRYVCAPEGCHHIFGFECQMRSHGVYRMAVHLPDQQSVVFTPGNEQQALDNSEVRGTTLTAYFKYNAEFDEAEKKGEDFSGKTDPRKIRYGDFPLYFTYEKTSGKWKQRARGQTIGRMYAVSPSDPERFALRLLLLATVGATSFQDLRTVPDENGNMITHPTFVLAARALGLLKDDAEYKRALREAASFQMPVQMRGTFTAMLVFNEVGDAQQLWEDFKTDLSEDFVFQGCSPDEAEALAYQDVREKMQRLSKNIEKFITPPSYILLSNVGPDIDYVAATSKGEQLYQTLNSEQKEICDRILASTEDSTLSRLFFLDGPGGSGKTYLYVTLFSILLGRHLKIVCAAWTGIASTLLPNGRTIASLIKLDISNECKTSLIKLNSPEAKLLREVDIIIYDESSMIPKDALQTTDQVLRDVTGIDKPFGGKIIILGGDFRQVLPVVRRGSKSDQIDMCIKSSDLWERFEICQLKSNMRVTSGDKEWISFLLDVGNGTENNEEEKIGIDPSCMSSGDLINDVFGSQISYKTDLSEKAILAPKNVDVDKMNEQVHDGMEGEEKIYYSRDEVTEDQPTFITTEFLNSINTSSLPPYKLKLKRGSVVMLLRNLDVASGLCNGTRLIVEEMGRRLLRCKFAVGEKKGKDVIIPKIDCYDDKNLAFKIKRTQFPVKLAFALSINKAQGQSFTHIGLYLPDDVFSHGQLYVALSRVRSKEGLKVKAEDSNLKNVVYREIL